MRRFYWSVYSVLFLAILLFLVPLTADFSGTKNFLSWNTAEAEVYDYYIPYALSDKNYWTGVALRNGSETASANVTVNGIGQDGSSFSSEVKAIPAAGQTAFFMSSGEGWVRISSNKPLTGLGFIAMEAGERLMFDIPFVAELEKLLCVPHVAQDATWDTTVFVCNPNGSQTTMYLSFFDAGGVKRKVKGYTLPANGSGKYLLSDFLGASASYDRGSVKISATQGVAAFALYNDLKSGGHCYAGISAVKLEESEQPPVIPPEEGILGNFKFVYTISSTWTDRITINKKTTNKTSDGTYIYSGYNADYPSTTLAIGAWYPSISKYLIVSGAISISSTFLEGYEFTINTDNSLTGIYRMSINSGSTWSSPYALIKSKSYKTPLGTSAMSIASHSDTLVGMDDVFARKIYEDQETDVQRTESSFSIDDVIVTKFNELSSIIKYLK